MRFPVPQHRIAHMIGRAFENERLGPLRPQCESVRAERHKHVDSIEYFVAFWFWVPPTDRQRWTGKSHVHDVSAQEELMLLTGELVEVARNYIYPESYSKQKVGDALIELWEAECRGRLGFVPERQQGRTALTPVVNPFAAEVAKTE